MTTTCPRVTRRRRIVMIASVAGALASAGALAGCGDAPEPGAATDRREPPSPPRPSVMPSTPTAIGNGCGSEPRAPTTLSPSRPRRPVGGDGRAYDSSASATIIAAPSAETACLAIRS